MQHCILTETKVVGSTKQKIDSKGEFALVALPLPLFQDFAYRIPAGMRRDIGTGSIVSVPFRRSVKTGFVTGFSDTPPPGEAKEIQDLLLETPVFSAELLKLAKWMSSYYYTAPGEILQVMQPVRINRESVELITLSEKGRGITAKELQKLHPLERSILNITRSRGRVTPEVLKREAGYYQLFYRLDFLKRRELISVEQAISVKKPQPVTQLFVRPLLNLSPKKQEEVFCRAPAQKELYTYIIGHAPVARAALLRQFPGKESALNALVEKQLVEKYAQEVLREYQSDEAKPLGRDSLPVMTPFQQEAVSAVEESSPVGKFAAYLLHGVTGSGKTRVYFELIHNALDRGHGALFLVPEIALTNYFLSALREQFAGTVAVLHSRMSTGERFDSWRGIISGKKRLVIGPRSAVFAPVHDLKLVIVDEEHDSSYKQHESPPYYHARDVAVYRARLEGARVILGSATPSMESYYNAQTGKYTLLKLPERIDNTPMPEVRLVDMREMKRGKQRPYGRIFSPELLTETEERLKKHEQVLLMLNRRGYSTFIQCCDCGYIETCPDCRITLTYHKKRHSVRCHFCGYYRKAPTVCPDCHGNNFRFSGYGTQQVEEALLRLTPGFRTIRMDQDTTRSKSAHRQITAQFERGESDILVGTQMVAKGFDFARVNLVGVISADTGMLLPEFRAAERTFQLMTQAAGRAGRRKERGVVIIQTMHPDHYSLEAAVRHDFRSFYESESGKRAELNYPPFGRIILLRFVGEDESRVSDAAVYVGNMLRKSRYRRCVLGPAPAPIEKIRKMYRWMIFLKSGKSEDQQGRMIRSAAQLAREHFDSSPHRRAAAMTIDVDPMNLL